MMSSQDSPDTRGPSDESEFLPPGARDDAPLPKHVGSYPVTRLLGRGGMGVVYAGEDPRLRRQIAIKVLPARLAADPDRLARFEREARLLAAINHPNIATIYSLEHADDLHYLTMEFVPGETLAQRIAMGPLPLADVLAYAHQIAHALEAAHAAGVIHLDLKPKNIKITPEEKVKLLDFGLARAGASGVRGLEPHPDDATMDARIQGSPGYMSPEQLRGDEIDHRSDIWAFGCVLYEMITAQLTFPSRSLFDQIAATLERQPDWSALPDRTPEGIRRLLADCLEKELDARLESMARVRQVLEDEIANQSQPMAAALSADGTTGPPTNLPLQLTSFVGREHSMAQLKRHLEKDRLVTVVGPGGCGKTRIAIEVGRRLLPRFPDGVWLVELAPITEPDQVQHAVADALGVREDSRRSLRDTLRLHLKNRELLLVLDNCEHLLEASARLAEALVQSCPRVRILASSRERLGIGGESLFQLRPLDTPESAALPPLERLERVESIRLFLDRARAADIGFTLTRENAPALAQICRRLDGIPLALELAAARVKALAPAEIARRLDDRFNFLTTGSRTAMPRHQTLRALIDWSFDHLSGKERILLRRLAVFAGGWTLEAVEEVCGNNGIEPWEVLDLHSQLVEKSLVERDVHGSRRTGQPRYRALETIREYARERLQESDEWSEIRKRHRRYFETMAAASSGHLVGPEQHAWSQRLEVEHDNLRAAIVGACGSGPDRDVLTAIKIAAALGRYWYGRGRWTEGRTLMKEILGLPGAETRDAARAQALAWTGWIALWQGDLDEAWSLNQESLDIRRELGDRMGISQSLNNLGAVAQERGEFARSRAMYEESLALRRAEGNLRYQAVSLHNLAELCFRMGQFEDSRAFNEESLALRREVGDLMGIADSLNALGMVAERMGDLEQARDRHEESLANRRQRDDPMGIAESLRCLAAIDAQEGRLGRARAFYAQSLAIQKRLGDRLNIAESLELIGLLAAREGSWERAAQILGTVATLRAEIESPTPPAQRAEVENATAQAQSALGDRAFAVEWERGRRMSLEQAIDLAIAEGGSAPTA